jgi:acyl-[acyl-carrier-protein]-phospholipid O-acyltransferase/long-chain-fatty-acid--[acyl-carrier-protein] ligase
VGAEKLKARLADAFESKFGIRPLEGYGATELSPVAAVNVPDTCVSDVLRPGHKEGSVGRPLPGVAIRILDPDTSLPLPVGEPGLVAVKGPNVMKGYLNLPEKTAEVLSDGWYITGDIGRLDQDGFLYITERLARFSKIAGEMIPHGAVEEALLAGLATTEPVLAVTSVPDERKGEKLLVLHTKAAGGPERLRRILGESGLPNLWKPARDAYLEIESLPLLASGKPDIQALRRMALQGMQRKGSLDVAA